MCGVKGTNGSQLWDSAFAAQAFLHVRNQHDPFCVVMICEGVHRHNILTFMKCHSTCLSMCYCGAHVLLWSMYVAMVHTFCCGVQNVAIEHFFLYGTCVALERMCCYGTHVAMEHMLLWSTCFAVECKMLL